MRGERRPVVYVYPSRVPCTDHRGDTDLVETKLASFFATRASAAWISVTTDPALADVFFHPACLTDVFFRARDAANKSATGGFRVPAEARAIELQLLAQIQSTGFWHRPHIVNALRCHLPSGLGQHIHGPRTFPLLWGNRSRFFTFCQEAFGPLDPQRSLKMWYCPRTPPPALNLRSARRHTVLFIGSTVGVSNPRQIALRALARTPGAHIVDLSSQPNGSRRERVDRDEQLLSLMCDSIFTLCPLGDTPDSQRIYQAVACGSVPLLNRLFQPPSIADWSNFSAPIASTHPYWHGPLKLPAPSRVRELQLGALAHARDFECEASNDRFASYVTEALRTLAQHSSSGAGASGSSSSSTTLTARAKACHRCVDHTRSEAMCGEACVL